LLLSHLLDLGFMPPQIHPAVVVKLLSVLQAGKVMEATTLSVTFEWNKRFFERFNEACAGLIEVCPAGSEVTSDLSFFMKSQVFGTSSLRFCINTKRE
jgi:hypothetical protein